MVIRGNVSDVVSARGVEELSTLIRHVRIESAEAGHMIAGDSNDIFAAQVLSFLDDLS